MINGKPPSEFNGIWWDSAKLAWNAQVDYGRWIVNTLWLMHSGAVAGLLYKWDARAPLPQSTAISFFIFGIVLAFVTACAAWLNFSVAEHLFRRWTYSKDDWPNVPIDENTKWMKRTTYVAIGAALGSLACLVAGAVSVIKLAH